MREVLTCLTIQSLILLCQLCQNQCLLECPLLIESLNGTKIPKYATIDLEDEDNIISQRSQAMAPATTGSEESKFMVEVAVNLSLNRAKTSVDILQFWSENEKRLPILARTVRKYMCIQASSSSSERTFSASGNIVTPRRNKLDPENVNMLVYLKENLGKVELPKLFPKTPSASAGGADRVEEDLDDTDFAASP